MSYIDRIQRWFAWKYVNKHIKVFQSQVVISNVDLVMASPSERNNLTLAYFRELQRQVLEVLVEEGAIMFEREKSMTMRGEIIKAKIKVWI